MSANDNTFEVYIDETSQTKHRYLILGGLVLPSLVSSKLEERLLLARTPELPAMELGWVKVSRSKLEAYVRFVDVFFDSLNDLKPLEFHSVVVIRTN